MNGSPSPRTRPSACGTRRPYTWLLAFLLLPLFLPAATSQADPPKPGIIRSVFSLEPEIDCPSCEDAISHVLVTAHGVQSAEVDVLNNRVTVRYDPASINARALIGRIKVTGYTATEVK